MHEESKVSQAHLQGFEFPASLAHLSELIIELRRNPAPLRHGITEVDKGLDNTVRVQLDQLAKALECRLLFRVVPNVAQRFAPWLREALEMRGHELRADETQAANGDGRVFQERSRVTLGLQQRDQLGKKGVDKRLHPWTCEKETLQHGQASQTHSSGPSRSLLTELQRNLASSPSSIVANRNLHRVDDRLDLLNHFGQKLTQVLLQTGEGRDGEVAQEGISGLPDFRDGVLQV